MLLKGRDCFRVDDPILLRSETFCLHIHFLEGSEIRVIQFVLARTAYPSRTSLVAVISTLVHYCICLPGKLELSKWKKNARETFRVMDQYPIILESICKNEVVRAHHSLVKRRKPLAIRALGPKGEFSHLRGCLANLQLSQSFPCNFWPVVVQDIARAKSLRSQKFHFHVVGHSSEQRVADAYDDRVDHYPQLVDKAHPKKVCGEIVTAEYGDVFSG